MTAAQALAPGWVAWLIYGVLALPVVWALRPRRDGRPSRGWVFDGWGSAAEKCGRNGCGLHVVRPGKFQCDADGCPETPSYEHPWLRGPAVKQVRR